MDLSAACQFLDAPCSTDNLAVSPLRHQVEPLQQRHLKSKPSSHAKTQRIKGLRSQQVAGSQQQQPGSVLPGILSPPGSTKPRPPGLPRAGYLCLSRLWTSHQASQRRWGEPSPSDDRMTAPQRMVQEAATEAEEVARQLRDAGMAGEAAQLEKLRVELLQPGTDLATTKNEARGLAERLRAQARERSGTMRISEFVRSPAVHKTRFQLHPTEVKKERRSVSSGLPAVCGTPCSLGPCVMKIG
eukprot:TRINITY_DN6963_c0_g2_i2.p1 TRINITY_DN6963_c0_g2~~TRINITY_DN6963_c0_g2_i2.p1  ORF type:complete len:243 (-),score=34.36 TRINITY_DN6963_c0_g2_i2:263-991(-)